MMQSANKIKFADEIKNKKYIDSYIDKWLKLDTLDKPYVECEICGYASNASIHQHLLVPEEFVSGSSNNRILHLYANCYYELRALMDKYNGMSPEKMPQLCEEAFEKLKDKKKHYKEANQSLGRVEV
jgi:hypothetical protein